MPFPPHILAVLDQYGIAPATKALLFDLYSSLGESVFDVFIEVAETVGGPGHVEPQQLADVRARAAELYLQKRHPDWREGRMTPSFWYPRVLEGRASGMHRPLGRVGEEESSIGKALPSIVRRAVGEGQPVPEGLILLGKNAHYGGRLETISFDIVPESLDDAILVSQAAGQQHTAPGSVGETSGTIDIPSSQALIWEIQPNVLKPTAVRNASLNKIWRKHRNWHVATLGAAIRWLDEQDIDIYVLRGAALGPTHEVNPAKPVLEMIEQFHDRTVAAVVEALEGDLVPITPSEVERMNAAELMNRALGKWVAEGAGESAFWRIVL